MATPTLTLINDGGLTDGVITDADTNTGWTNLTTADTDIKVEGVASMSGITRSDGEDSFYTDPGGAPVTAVGKILRGWVNTTNLPYMGIESVNPYDLWVSDGTTQSNSLALFGSDTYPGGWFYYWQDMDDFTGPALANIEEWGIEAGHANNAKNAINMWMDVMRYMDGYTITGGTGGDKVAIFDLGVADKVGAYGIVRDQFGVYFATGTVQIGNGATTTYFTIDGDVLVFLDTPGALSITAGLYNLNAQGTGCDCLIQNSVLRANGITDNTRFVLDFSDTDATVSILENSITRASTIDFAVGQTNTSNIFDDCGQITPAGADISGSTVKNYEGTAGTAAVVYNIASDPDGEFDFMTFTKGTAATHAIEFGSTTPSTITLRGCDFNGYNAGIAQNDSTFLLSGVGDRVINLVNCTGNFTYRTTVGITVTIVIDPVDLDVTVTDINTQAAVVGARVLIIPADGTNFKYLDAITSITRSGSTAEVTHTAHGLTPGDSVLIEGADQEEYNGAFVTAYSVTLGSNGYEITVAGTPTTPATGTILGTQVLISDTTDVNGKITDNRSYSVDQIIAGRVRRATNGTLYKTSPINATVNAIAGLALSVQMIPDE
jgi:hypothetical protein